MEFPDLPALLRIVRAHRGVIVALDNTWGAGLAFDAFALGGEGEALGADISIQALTKYPSGGADVLMGAVTTRDEALHQRLKATHMRMGWGVGVNDVEAGAALAAVAGAALRGAGPRRPRARGLVGEAARGRRACCIRRCRLARVTSTGRALCTQAAGPVLDRLRRALRAAPRSMPSSMR